MHIVTLVTFNLLFHIYFIPIKLGKTFDCFRSYLMYTFTMVVSFPFSDPFFFDA